LCIGGGGSGPQSIVRVEGCWGENGYVILVGPELFRFPRVWEGLGIQCGVAEHFLQFGVVKRAVDGGVDFLLGWGGGLNGPMGGYERGHGVDRKGLLVGRGRWADPSQGGVVRGPWGPRGERWGLWGER